MTQYTQHNKPAYDRKWWDEPDDRYGFEPPEDEEGQRREQVWHKAFLRQKQDILKEWSAYDKEISEKNAATRIDDSVVANTTFTPQRKSSFGSMLSSVTNVNVKKLIRKGIPGSRRAKEWFERSGAARKKADNEGKYAQYVATSIAESITDEIQMDIARTFSIHMMFSDVNTKQMMLRLLCAYAVRNPKYGYCQNMTCIIGIILFFLPEEDAFWLFATIMEDILPRDFCSPTLIGLRVDQRVLEVLIKERLPKVHANFAKFSVDISCFTTSWLLRLFVNVLPIETTLRVWDCFLYEGSKILFRVALAFLKLHEEQVRQCGDAGELLTFLNGESKRFYDADKLIKACGSFWNLKRTHINELRERVEREVAAETATPRDQ
jgi:hypothetical protein